MYGRFSKMWLNCVPLALYATLSYCYNFHYNKMYLMMPLINFDFFIKKIIVKNLKNEGFYPNIEVRTTLCTLY